MIPILMFSGVFSIPLIKVRRSLKHLPSSARKKESIVPSMCMLVRCVPTINTRWSRSFGICPRWIRRMRLAASIGTQTLEVGIDVDFANMVTEIAPGSALVQRAGRVNRRGMRPEGSLHVFGLDLQQFNEKKQAQQGVSHTCRRISMRRRIG